jgi:Glycosyl hydrolase family 20, domain 2
MSSTQRDDEGECSGKSVLLSLSEDPIQLPHELDPSRFNMDEAYTLSVSAEHNCIIITGHKPAGVFYGIVSLISLAHGNVVVVTKHN